MNYIERSENPEFESILPMDFREVFGTPEEEGALGGEENPNPQTTEESCGGASKSPWRS
jgi:hypothetical protein